MTSDRDRRIQHRAYEIWVAGGSKEGTAAHDWAQAEREVGQDDGHATAAGKKASAAKGKAAEPSSKADKAAAKKAAKPASGTSKKPAEKSTEKTDKAAPKSRAKK